MSCLKMPPAIVRPADDLTALASRINEREDAIAGRDRANLDDYRRQGEDLLRAKAQCGHGKWLPWLAANVRVKQSRAKQYMQWAKSPVTGDLDEDLATWRHISGNVPSEDAGEPGPPPLPAVVQEWDRGLPKWGGMRAGKVFAREARGFSELWAPTPTRTMPLEAKDPGDRMSKRGRKITRSNIEGAANWAQTMLQIGLLPTAELCEWYMGWPVGWTDLANMTKETFQQWLALNGDRGEARPMKELHLFAGAGGGILGGMLLGHACACAVEIEPYCRKVLLARQRDGILPRFPIEDDVRTFDGNPWRGRVDVVCGGFPCQDISIAGKGAGISGSRSGLWREMVRIVSEVRPRFLFLENSPLLVQRGLALVLSDLAEMGFDARWGIVSAAEAGAPHRRERLWLVGTDAHRDDDLDPRRMSKQSRAQASQVWNRGIGELVAEHVTDRLTSYGGGLRRLQGMPHRADRLAAAGNGQVPVVAAIAWQELAGDEDCPF